MEKAGPKSNRKFRLMSHCADIIADAIIRTGDDDKRIARRIGSVPRSVKNWRLRNNAPRADELLALAREYEEVRTAVIEIIASKGERYGDRN